MVRSASLGSWRVCNYAKFDGQIIDAFNKTSLHLNILEWSSPLQGHQAYGQLTSEASLVQAVISVHDHGAWVGDIDIISALSHSTVVLSEAECRPIDTSYVSFGDQDIWTRQHKALPTRFSEVGSSRSAETGWTDRQEPLPVRTSQPGSTTTGKPRTETKHKPGLPNAISMCSVDYWDEILDLSRDNSVLVVRCHGNWLARLGTIGVLTGRFAAESIIVCPKACKNICWRCFTGIEDNDEAKDMRRVICIL